MWEIPSPLKITYAFLGERVMFLHGINDWCEPQVNMKSPGDSHQKRLNILYF